MLAALFVFLAVFTVAPVRVHAEEVTEEYTVSGVWSFNDVLSLPSERIDHVVNFTLPYSSFTYSFTKIILSSTNVTYSYRNGSASGSFGVYGSSGWSTPHSDVQTVDFGETEQVVSEEFYTWLNANATFQAPPPDPGPLVEATAKVDLTAVLLPILTIIPIGLVCLVGYKGLRKGLDLLRRILHQA